MKVFVILATFILFVNAKEYCYNDILRRCDATSSKTITPTENCNAKYGGINEALVHLQQYVNTHISRSFEYLLMSTHYANYQMNRAGFEQLFRKMSDSTWDDAIDLIKYITKRGGTMNFQQRHDSFTGPEESIDKKYETYEIQSMARAVDMQKQMAQEAFDIHKKVTKVHHDPEMSSFIEEHFAHKHAETIRKLSGHVSDLSKLLNKNDYSLSLFLFDEYLQK